MSSLQIIVLGALFQIEEENFKHVLLRRLQKVNIQSAQKAVQDHFIKTIKMPKPIFKNAACRVYRTWLFNPAVRLERDIVDIKGNVLKKKGEEYNPLNDRYLSTQLVFIEGISKEQIAWALKQPKAKIVLVNGSPIVLEETHRIPFYYDQGGSLCRKFRIYAFPARVFQEGKHLRCEEVPVEEKS